MTDMPTISFAELQKRIKKIGFIKVRQKGSHIRFVHSDGRKTTIPDHGNKDVPKGLLLKIIRYDLEMDVSDFLRNM
ncbi:type II toxin-antitoxin system HicA family toxin [Desulfonema magnum]|uniref:Toxin-antitoxin system, toxin component, HicA domain-containing protein n=1 Tax=Desulfonema magnum TaxID=45655 RepID=A0A975GQE4_9BACT|nr:type II toxin-antitoxin system HicA family toxin [Desulfonema magnum]QTA88858.1 Toxin-antitoxin system, toxin component, HicA domain-containing protein [Desulfonema magnum]